MKNVNFKREREGWERGKGNIFGRKMKRYDYLQTLFAFGRVACFTELSCFASRDRSPSHCTLRDNITSPSTYATGGKYTDPVVAADIRLTDNFFPD